MALLGLQFTFSFVLFALVAKWYITPALDKLPPQAALVPLFLVHALRYLPSSAFAPGQVGAAVPMNAMAEIAYGDLVSAVLSLLLVGIGMLLLDWPLALVVLGGFVPLIALTLWFRRGSARQRTGRRWARPGRRCGARTRPPRTGRSAPSPPRRRPPPGSCGRGSCRPRPMTPGSSG